MSSLLRSTVLVASTYRLADGSSITTNGSGFFLSFHRRVYVITAAHVVTTVNNGSQPRQNPPPIAYPLTKNNEIWVQYQQRIYSAILLGVDPGTDLAVLRLSCLEESQVTPLSWANEEANFNEPCIIASSPLGSIFQSLTQGVVANPHYGPDEIGTELLLTDAVALQGGSGAPIYVKGKGVVALLIESLGDNLGNNLNGGPTARVCQPVVSKLIKQEGNVIPVLDPTGNYYRYVRGFMGFTYELFSAASLSAYPKSLYREVQGLVIFSIIPNTPAAQVFGYPQSDGIIITKIDEQPIGMLEQQIMPSVITWSLGPGRKVTLSYRLYSEFFDIERKVALTLGTYPPEIDVPAGNLSEKRSRA